MLISFAVTTKLICVFVFAYAKSRFSHDAAQVIVVVQNYNKSFGIRLAGHAASKNKSLVLRLF